MSDQIISVVIPCFNRQDRIARAIESVLGQSRKADEIIVIDDGSTDKSVEVIEQFGSSVKLIAQKNQGAAAARNAGIRQCKGNWIAFLDSDDTWHPSKLEMQAQVAISFPEAAVIFTDTCTTRASKITCKSRFDLGGLRENSTRINETLFRCTRPLYTRMLNQSRVITSAAMVRKNTDRFFFPEEIWGSEDWALWLSLILEGDFIAIDQIMVTMDAGEDNLTHARGRGKLLRNDVAVLEQLLKDPRLTLIEREATQIALRERKSEAVYHSLIRGETSQARKILLNYRAQNISFPKWIRYFLASFTPARILRHIANQRKLY